MRRILLLICILLAPLSVLSAQQRATLDEVAIYDTVMRTLLKEDREKDSVEYYPVILRQTKLDEDLSLDFYMPYRGLLKNFRIVNNHRIGLDENLSIGKYFFIEEERLNEYLNKARKEIRETRAYAASQNIDIVATPSSYWKYFDQKYPQAIGLYTLSRVGFTPHHEYALVAVSQIAGFRGYHRAYVLRRLKNRWKIIRWEGGNWIS